MNKAVPCEKSLAYLKPELAMEWAYRYNNGMKPEDYVCGSNKKVFWVCGNEHIWEAPINRRVRGSGCPYCAGKKVLKGFNDFKTKCPDKVSLWNYRKNRNIDPDMCYFKSGKKVWWICQKGHEWQTTIYKIYNGGKCKVCCSALLQKGDNDLQTRYPEICKKWDYELNEKQPCDYFPKSTTRVHWICDKGHRWEARICCTVTNNTVCPICSGKKLAKGVNDLATLAPKEILEEWDYEKNGFSPDGITAHNNRKCWWKCKKCNRKWAVAVEKRMKRGDGCPYCSGRLPKLGETDLATLHPELKSWWSEDNAQDMGEYTEFSYFNVKWRCPTCGEAFKRVIAKQVLYQSCPYCTGRRFIQGKSDLATRRPDLMIEWNYQKNKKGPECYSTFSNKKVWWMCTVCGNEWFAMINNRSSKGRGCPKCCRKIIN